MAKGDRHNQTDEVKHDDVEINNEPDEKIKELQEKYLRALADYQNLEKQTQVWREEFAAYANSDLIRELLEVLDDLEKANDHLQDDGLELVIAKFKKILANFGVTELDLEGKEFDANHAEVVSTEPFDPAEAKTGEKSNIISKVLQKGYLLKDRVVRPAKVVVTTTA